MADKEPAVDMINYKGIYFEDDSGQKYTCPESGAHFEYLDMFRRLKRVGNSRDLIEETADGNKTSLSAVNIVVEKKKIVAKKIE
jgi:hypothetical protein